MKQKKMVKIAIAVVVGAGLLGTIALILFLMNLGPVIKQAVETVGPRMTGGPVTIEDISVAPFSGGVSIRGVTIGNPEGFKTPSAFELGEVRVRMQLGSLMSDKIVINEISIDGPKVTYEAKLGGSNVSAIMDNINAFAGGGAAPSGEAEAPAGTPAAEAAGPGKKLQIDQFSLTNAKISMSATMLQGKGVTLPMPPVNLSGIGEGDGATPAEAAKEIYGAVSQGVLDVVKAAGDAAKETAKEVGETVKKGAKDAVEGVKGLFGRKK